MAEPKVPKIAFYGPYNYHMEDVDPLMLKLVKLVRHNAQMRMAARRGVDDVQGLMSALMTKFERENEGLKERNESLQKEVACCVCKIQEFKTTYEILEMENEKLQQEIYDLEDSLFEETHGPDDI